MKPHDRHDPPVRFHSTISLRRHGLPATGTGRAGPIRGTRPPATDDHRSIAAEFTQLKIENVDRSRDVPDGAGSVTFDVRLSPGLIRLRGLRNRDVTRRAFYVQVQRIK